MEQEGREQRSVPLPPKPDKLLSGSARTGREHAHNFDNHDERCCMASVPATAGPHPDCPGCCRCGVWPDVFASARKQRRCRRAGRRPLTATSDYGLESKVPMIFRMSERPGCQRPRAATSARSAASGRIPLSDNLTSVTRTFRRPWRQAALAILSFAVAVFAGLIAMTLPEEGASASEVVAYSAAAPAALAGGVRALFVRVTADDRQVRLHNYMSTRTIPWSEVAAIDPPPEHGALRKTGIRVRHVDGTVSSAAAFVKGPLDSPDLGHDVVTSLREMGGLAA